MLCYAMLCYVVASASVQRRAKKNADHAQPFPESTKKKWKTLKNGNLVCSFRNARRRGGRGGGGGAVLTGSKCQPAHAVPGVCLPAQQNLVDPPCRLVHAVAGGDRSAGTQRHAIGKIAEERSVTTPAACLIVEIQSIQNTKRQKVNEEREEEEEEEKAESNQAMLVV